jgi:hypothetical protein
MNDTIAARKWRAAANNRLFAGNLGARHLWD